MTRLVLVTLFWTVVTLALPLLGVFWLDTDNLSTRLGGAIVVLMFTVGFTLPPMFRVWAQYARRNQQTAPGWREFREYVDRDVELSLLLSRQPEQEENR